MDGQIKAATKKFEWPMGKKRVVPGSGETKAEILISLTFQ